MYSILDVSFQVIIFPVRKIFQLSISSVYLFQKTYLFVVIAINFVRIYVNLDILLWLVCSIDGQYVLSDVVFRIAKLQFFILNLKKCVELNSNLKTDLKLIE